MAVDRVSEYAGSPPDDGAETLVDTGWPASSEAQTEQSVPAAGQAIAPIAPPITSAGIQERSGWRVRLTFGVVIALAAVAGWAIYAMHTNERRAVGWEHRAQRLQGETVELKGLLAARTRLLNQRIDQMNKLARKLRSSQVALGQSQQDVSSLEVRQRELANEKAQLEDQQRELDLVAGAYVTCKADLIQLFNDIANSFDTTDSYNSASTDCNSADDSMQNYLGTYPNG